MKLETVSNLLTRIGFDPINTVEALAGESLEAATLELESYLRYKTFARAQYDDRFQLRSIRRYSLGSQVRLNLSTGMIAPETFTLYEAGSQLLMESQDFVEVAAGSYHLDAEKGRVTIVDKNVSHMSLKATYTAGLPNNDGVPDLYDGAPSWLSSLALTQAIIRMDQTNPTLRHDSDSEASLAVRSMKGELERAAASHIRYFADGEEPING